VPLDHPEQSQASGPKGSTIRRRRGLRAWIWPRSARTITETHGLFPRLRRPLHDPMRGLRNSDASSAHKAPAPVRRRAMRRAAMARLRD